MLKIEGTRTYGWEAAVYGMRNPMNSWEMMDSDFTQDPPVLGEKDLKLAEKLARAGSDHGKYLRMIMVSFNMTAPLYLYKEFDTYKVATVANSTSTMHKIQAKEFTREDFSCEHLNPESMELLDATITMLNHFRDRFNRDHNKDDWWQMIQLLPSSFNQKRTIMLNYAVLKNIYQARKNHKLDEWHVFCRWVETLPYSELILQK